MKYVPSLCLAALASLLPAPLVAAPFDGTQPFICANIEIYACEPGVKCDEETVESIDVPQFLKISVPDKTIVGTRPSGQAVNAKIELVRHVEQKMYLQGVEKLLGWTVIVDEQTGRMSLTVSDDKNGYVIFGACTGT
ncbi:MAG TPA: hypothetical protein VEJ16_13865 [Alphaproteobacteria bacterium]|nr:hypothetical protein [Alphaproteobacteria bacterium]